MNKNRNNQQGSVLILAIVVVIIVGGVGLILTRGNSQGLIPQYSQKGDRSGLATNLDVPGELMPGSVVEFVLEKHEEKVAKLESVKLDKEGYVHIYKSSHGHGEPTLLGKSELLSAGTHSNLEIVLTAPALAGDTILIGLYDSAGNKLY